MRETDLSVASSTNLMQPSGSLKIVFDAYESVMFLEMNFSHLFLLVIRLGVLGCYEGEKEGKRVYEPSMAHHVLTREREYVCICTVCMYVCMCVCLCVHVCGSCLQPDITITVYIKIKGSGH